VHLPEKAESADAFIARAHELIRRTTTSVYVDTSFLMWLTKIGAASRRELLDWLNAVCPGRVHVPTWAAHEYFRHHVAATIPSELTQRARDLSGVAAQTYAYLRPFMDGPLSPDVGDVDAFRTEVRSTLTELKRVARAVGSWIEHYGYNSTEVIAFINGCAPCNADVFDYMSTIDAVSDGRFGGRVPPGFRDRRKAERQAESGGLVQEADPLILGSNRWGDLIFWKEILDHAKASKRLGVVILSNDRKNDWYLNATAGRTSDDGATYSPKLTRAVPAPHPMLEHEARSAAGVTELVLLDSPYLGLLLNAAAPDRVKSFVDVAIVPPQPEPASRKDLRSEAIKTRARDERAKQNAAAAELGLRFVDGDSVVVTDGALRRALFESRKAPDAPVVALLERCRATAVDEGGVSALMTADSFSAWTAKMLVGFARELHDRSLSDQPGWKEATVDLCGLLRELPPKTAGCLYLGLLASMYLERSSDTPRLPPQSRAATLLFERQGDGFAGPALAVLAKVMTGSTKPLPLYLPGPNSPAVAVTVGIEPDRDGQEQVARLEINNVDVLTTTQGDEALTLTVLFSGQATIKGVDLIQRACELLCVPLSQVIDAGDFDRDFGFSPTTGFRKPGTVSVPNNGAL